MKLACLRCKTKKIKCDKAEGRCHQCVTAQAECVYVERRQRPRFAQQRNEVYKLNRRLEFLEKHLSSAEHEGSPTSPSRSRETSIDEAAPGSQHSASPTAPLMTEDGQDSWIYRLASDARRNFEKANTNCQTTPVDTPETSNVGTAMSALDIALGDLGKLRIRSDGNAPRSNAFEITPTKAKECIETFLGIADTWVIPEAFTSSIDWNLMRFLPEIIDSPHVKVEPAMRVLYYNALYYSLHKINGPGDNLAKGAYFKALEAVPTWLDAVGGSSLDAHAAALTTWTAINNFDYQLSWKFHCKSCQFLKVKGVDRLDVTPAKTHEEENERNKLRYLYYHVLQTDLLFQLFYNKPSAIRWRPDYVKAPTLFTPSNMQPKAAQGILHVVWMRYTLMTAEIFQIIENTSEDEHSHLDSQIEEYCSDLEEMIIDFDLEMLMKSPRQPPVIGFLYADHVINIYASIIGIKRLTRRAGDTEPVDNSSLKAARNIIGIILHFEALTTGLENSDFVFIHFISFYPFCAVFSLYQHILACTNADDCEEDLQSLELIGAAMKEVSNSHSDFVPVCNTLLALNKVSRTMQDSRRAGCTSPTHHQLTDKTEATPSLYTQNPSSSEETLHAQEQGINLPPSTSNAFQMLASPSLDLSGPGIPFLPDFATNAGGEFQPLGFVRALESDFIGRNWHETWWDMNGDINMEMTNIPPET